LAAIGAGSDRDPEHDTYAYAREYDRDGVQDAVVDLAAGGEGALSIPLGFSPREVGTAILNVLTGSTADYAMSGSLSLDSPFGPMELPFQSEGVAPLQR